MPTEPHEPVPRSQPTRSVGREGPFPALRHRLEGLAGVDERLAALDRQAEARASLKSHLLFAQAPAIALRCERRSFLIQFDNDHVGDDPDSVRWDIAGNRFGAELLADPWVVNAPIFPGAGGDPKR